MDQVKERLFSLQDAAYRQMQIRLLPTLAADSIIGVRTPALRKLSKELENPEVFLEDLPHAYFEENLLHAFLLERERDFGQLISRLEVFLPYVDNWATCDQLRPKIFARKKAQLLPYLQTWLDSGQTYTLRFAVGMLMVHFLDGDFRPEYPQWVAWVRHQDYYVKMMVAWYFATALAKQYAAVLPYLENQSLETWTHNKTIRKAVESYRISPEQKAYLRTLKR